VLELGGKGTARGGGGLASRRARVVRRDSSAADASVNRRGEDVRWSGGLRSDWTPADGVGRRGCCRDGLGQGG
jgi:hypothetical protein